MGGGYSAANAGMYNQDICMSEYKNEFLTLCLKTSEVRSLYDVYKKMDNSKNNAVEIDAIFLFLDINSDFLRKIFLYTIRMKMKQCDRTVEESDEQERRPEEEEDCGRSSGENAAVSFDVFVFATWSLCSLQPSFFELFVFDVYLECPEQEHMCSEEVQGMLEDIYGAKGGGNFHAVRALSILQDNDNIDDFYDIDDFYEFTYQNHVVQFALFSLQTKLQAHICSSSFWEKVAERRYRKFYGYSSIAEILRWGEYAEMSTSSAGGGTVPRKFSAVSLSAQKFLLDVLRGPAQAQAGLGPPPGLQEEEGGSNSGVFPEQQLDVQALRSPHKLRPISGFNAAFAAHSALQQRRSSITRDNKNGIDSNRRRSFDVTVILKDRDEDQLSSRPQPFAVDSSTRRHSVVV